MSLNPSQTFLQEDSNYINNKLKICQQVSYNQKNHAGKYWGIFHKSLRYTTTGDGGTKFFMGGGSSRHESFILVHSLCFVRFHFGTLHKKIATIYLLAEVGLQPTANRFRRPL